MEQESQQQSIEQQPEQICNRVFIYGTLRSDLGKGVRNIAHNWLGYKPKVTNDAAVLGKLFYFRYPVLLLPDVVPGPYCEWIKGQLLEFQPEQMEGVLWQLDMVEGYFENDPYASLYHRKLVTVHFEDESFVKAWVYTLALNPIGSDWKEFLGKRERKGE